MNNETGLFLVIAASAAVNYLIRVVPWFMSDWDRVPLFFRRFLTILPIAALGALIFPGAVTSLADTGRAWAGFVGLAAAALTAHFSRNLIFPVAAAVLVTWGVLQIPV